MFDHDTVRDRRVPAKLATLLKEKPIVIYPVTGGNGAAVFYPAQKEDEKKRRYVNAFDGMA